MKELVFNCCIYETNRPPLPDRSRRNKTGSSNSSLSSTSASSASTKTVSTSSSSSSSSSKRGGGVGGGGGIPFHQRSSYHVPARSATSKDSVVASGSGTNVGLNADRAHRSAINTKKKHQNHKKKNSKIKLVDCNSHLLFQSAFLGWNRTWVWSLTNSLRFQLLLLWLLLCVHCLPSG